MNEAQQIVSAIRENTQVLREFIGIIKEKEAEWVGPKRALEILRKKNPDIMKLVREYHLSDGFIKSGHRTFEYNVAKLKALREKMDKGEVVI